MGGPCFQTKEERRNRSILVSGTAGEGAIPTMMKDDSQPERLMPVRQIAVSSLNNSRLELILLPTERCNLTCSYCYEDHHLGRMRPQVVSAIKELLRKRCPELRQLRIAWFGGEPLLELPIIREISECARTLSQTHPQVEYQSDMTTNAYLLSPDVFVQLFEYGITTFQITLDGFENDHDQFRKRKNDQGSFATIWNNLLEIKELDLPVTIILRLHFSTRHLKNMDKLISEVNRHFGPCGGNMIFKIFFKQICNFTSEIPNGFSQFPLERQNEIQADLYEKLHPDSIQFEQLPVCYAALANSFVIRPNGVLAKCSVALRDNRNMVGKIKETGQLEIDANMMSFWLRGLSSNDDRILACPIYVK